MEACNGGSLAVLDALLTGEDGAPGPEGTPRIMTQG